LEGTPLFIPSERATRVEGPAVVLLLVILSVAEWEPASVFALKGHGFNRAANPPVFFEINPRGASRAQILSSNSPDNQDGLDPASLSSRLY
jgi:hypothetical protein